MGNGQKVDKPMSGGEREIWDHQ